nr:PAAR domain-containing protein [Pseudarthrobacter sp. NIBRBAC000502772]
MPGAARVGDTTAHGGTVVGPGVATVLIAGMPAAVVGDMHACVIPSPPPHPRRRRSSPDRRRSSSRDARHYAPGMPAPAARPSLWAARLW